MFYKSVGTAGKEYYEDVSGYKMLFREIIIDNKVTKLAYLHLILWIAFQVPVNVDFAKQHFVNKMIEKTKPSVEKMKEAEDFFSKTFDEILNDLLSEGVIVSV